MRQFRGGQPSRNRAPGCGYAGIPPLPPLLKGGTTRNGIRMKTRLVQDETFITARQMQAVDRRRGKHVLRMAQRGQLPLP